jgi:hypothetical protein
MTAPLDPRVAAVFRALLTFFGAKGDVGKAIDAALTDTPPEPEPLKGCQYCHAQQGWLQCRNGSNGYYVRCSDCGARGPLGKTEAAARAAWNRRAGE